MNIYFMDDDTYDRLNELRIQLHNAQRAMTFDEQRDYAETFRLLMERVIQQG